MVIDTEPIPYHQADLTPVDVHSSICTRKESLVQAIDGTFMGSTNFEQLYIRVPGQNFDFQLAVWINFDKS